MREHEHSTYWVIGEEATDQLRLLRPCRHRSEAGRSTTVATRQVDALTVGQTLLKLDSQNNFKRYLKAISGIVFLATPHLTSLDDKVSQTLAGILRFQTRSWAKTLFPKDDLENLAWNALKFTELRLQCPVLSCYETKTIKVSRSLPRPARKVQVST